MAYKIIVDAGHGGNDPGAVSGNLKEKDFNLKVALYMYDRFKELGIPVKIIRDTDETIDKPERINRINNAFGDDPEVILLSNHINAGGAEGAEIIYALRNNDILAKSILSSIGDEGQIERKYYQLRLPEDPSKDYYFIMRETGNIMPLLIEYGFIDNPKDVQKLENNILNYAEAVVKAVTNYIGYTYIAPDGSLENTYTVVRGDSLYSIAKKFNTTVEELKRLNNLDSNFLNIGQVLIVNQNKIPDFNNKYLNYIVKKGDTLYRIAQIYDTSVKELIEINNLKNTSLYIGQTIKIPNTEEENIVYTVIKGDSLYSIARRFHVTVQELIDKNGLTSNSLQIGDKLVIPKKDMNDSELKKYINHIVTRGESLYSISKKYDTTVDIIKELNNLNTNLLQIGQILKIPIN